MNAPAVLDISRLIFDAGRRTPTGILRVELAYARYLLATRSDGVVFAARNALGRMALVKPRQALRLLSRTERLWADETTLPFSALALRCFFYWIHTTLLWRGEWKLYPKLRGSDGPAVYILVSHANLDRPKAIRRLKHGTGARLVFFFHDLIPLQFPEFETAGWDKKCERRLQAAVELGDAILVNSRHTKEEMIKEAGPSLPRVIVTLLGVSVARTLGIATPPAGRPYFVIVGTIEPKKNHLLLLNLWRQLRDQMGDDTPRLIVVGRRGWENENIIDLLERSRALKGVVEERGRVSDRELSALLAGARALLLPSFAEGFGLPLAEALAAGIPAICSDIAAFREVGGEVPEFLDPLDGPAWRRAIIDYAADPSPRREAQLVRMSGWTAPRWEDHFRAVGDLIRALQGPLSPSPGARSQKDC